MPKSISRYKKVLLYSLGDPCGISPEILVKSLSDQNILNSGYHLAVADRESLLKAASFLGISIAVNTIESFEVKFLKPGFLNVLNISNAERVKVAEPNIYSAKASLEYLELSSKIIEEHGLDIDALITLPLSKEAISSLGLEFKEGVVRTCQRKHVS